MLFGNRDIQKLSSSDDARSAKDVSCSGFSRIEVICLVVIAAFLALLALALGANMIGDMHEGNDSITVETAQTCGYTEVQNQCFVLGCPGGSSAKHKTHVDAKGNKFAYFDKVSNRLVGERPKGYNEHEVEGADGEHFSVGNAVVRVTDYNGSIVCDWVLGE